MDLFVLVEYPIVSAKCELYFVEYIFSKYVWKIHIYFPETFFI